MPFLNGQAARSINLEETFLFFGNCGKKDMQINIQEINGIFKVKNHTSFIRFVWIILVSISLSIVAYGVFAVKANIFDFSQDVRLKYFEIGLAALLILVAPAYIFFVGFIKIIKKPGIYFTGVMVADNLEIGTFSLNANPVSTEKYLENQFIVKDMVEWKQKKLFKNNTINILIVISERYELSKQFLLEQVVFSSKEQCLIKMFGHDSSGIHWNNIVALSQGSLYLLGNDDGIYPDDLFSFRKQIANIISKWKHPFVLSCTLKTIPNLANIESVLAFGVLGGINATDSKSVKDREFQEIIFASLNNEKNSSIDSNQA